MRSVIFTNLQVQQAPVHILSGVNAPEDWMVCKKIRGGSVSILSESGR